MVVHTRNRLPYTRSSCIIGRLKSSINNKKLLREENIESIKLFRGEHETPSSLQENLHKRIYTSEHSQELQFLCRRPGNWSTLLPRSLYFHGRYTLRTSASSLPARGLCSPRILSCICCHNEDRRRRHHCTPQDTGRTLQKYHYELYELRLCVPRKARR